VPRLGEPLLPPRAAAPGCLSQLEPGQGGEMPGHPSDTSHRPEAPGPTRNLRVEMRQQPSHLRAGAPTAHTTLTGTASPEGKMAAPQVEGRAAPKLPNQLLPLLHTSQSHPALPHGEAINAGWAGSPS